MRDEKALYDELTAEAEEELSNGRGEDDGDEED